MSYVDVAKPKSQTCPGSGPSGAVYQPFPQAVNTATSFHTEGGIQYDQDLQHPWSV